MAEREKFAWPCGHIAPAACVHCAEKYLNETIRLKARIEELEAEIRDKTDYHMNDAVEQVIQRRLGPGHKPEITGGKDE